MWKIMVHVLLKPGLENFEYYFASMWDECNCVVVWTFFGIAFLGDWNEDLSFHPVAIAEFKLDLKKAEEPEVKLPTSIGSLKKHESSREASTSALLTTPMPLTGWITTKCGKLLKRWEYQTHLTSYNYCTF